MNHTNVEHRTAQVTSDKHSDKKDGVKQIPHVLDW